jgi:beta-lactamase superfamily II metal-dependent hydrolase
VINVGGVRTVLAAARPYALRGTALAIALSACGGAPPTPAPAPAPAPALAPAPAPAEAPLTEEFKAKPKKPPEDGGLRGPHLGMAPVLLGQPASGRLKVHFIDVGQGDSTLVECPGGARILVDGGSGISASSRPENAATYLHEALGASMSLDAVIVTHPDRDHYNALPYLLEEVTFDRLWLVGRLEAYNSSSFKTWLDAVPASKKKWVRTETRDPQGQPNADLDCGSADIFMLSAAATGANASWAANTSSMVLMISHGDFDVLLTGDATVETEQKITDAYDAWWLDVEVLKIGHHGSSTTSTSVAWLDAVKPEIATVSSGHDNEHGHPRKVVGASRSSACRRSSTGPTSARAGPAGTTRRARPDGPTVELMQELAKKHGW